MSYTTLSLANDRFTIVRTVAGVIAADNSTLSEVNIPVASALNCVGFDTILVRPVITAGTNPAVVIEPLFYDEFAVSGARWQRLILSPTAGAVPAGDDAIPTTCALGNGQMEEIQTFGFKHVFLRIASVVNPALTSNLVLLAYPGARSARWMRGV